MVQALIGDAKDFWRYSTFSDWAKIGDFRDFRRLLSVKKCTEYPYFNAVRVDLVIKFYSQYLAGTSEV